MPLLRPAVVLSALSLTVVLAGCGGGGAPAGSGPIANPLAASCPDLTITDPAAYGDDGTFAEDAETAAWPSSGSSPLADELGVQDVINGSCYYDYKDQPFSESDAGAQEGGYFFRVDPDSSEIEAYLEKMNGYLTDKGFEVTVQDTGFDAKLGDAGVGAYFVEELTEEMFAGANNQYEQLGFEVGDSMLFGGVSRNP